MLPPLRSEWMLRLGDEAHPVVLTPPVGAREPRGVLLGVHGAGDRPEWACGGWRLAADARWFVVCPSGTESANGRYVWSSAGAIERALDEALDQARRRFGAYMAERLVYAGFSQGAILAEPILRRRARQLPIAILAEGGYGFTQSPGFARAYHAGGGRRIALVCGTPGCFRHATRARPVLERAGLQVLMVGDARAGHNLNQRMQQALRRAWSDISAPLTDG